MQLLEPCPAFQGQGLKLRGGADKNNSVDYENNMTITITITVIPTMTTMMTIMVNGNSNHNDVKKLEENSSNEPLGSTAMKTSMIHGGT